MLQMNNVAIYKYVTVCHSVYTARGLLFEQVSTVEKYSYMWIIWGQSDAWSIQYKYSAWQRNQTYMDVLDGNLRIPKK